jgi:hypothetical protein
MMNVRETKEMQGRAQNKARGISRNERGNQGCIEDQERAERAQPVT